MIFLGELSLSPRRKSTLPLSVPFHRGIYEKVMDLFGMERKRCKRMDKIRYRDKRGIITVFLCIPVNLTSEASNALYPCCRTHHPLAFRNVTFMPAGGPIHVS